MRLETTRSASYCIAWERRSKESQRPWEGNSASIAHGMFHALVVGIRGWETVGLVGRRPVRNRKWESKVAEQEP
jgi:hypothetical protein